MKLTWLKNIGTNVQNVLRRLFADKIKGDFSYPNITYRQDDEVMNAADDESGYLSPFDVDEAGVMVDAAGTTIEEHEPVLEPLNLYVPPMQANLQNAYVPDHIPPQLRKCAAYPLCSKNVNECGGWRTTTCRFVNQHDVIEPANVLAIQVARRSRTTGREAARRAVKRAKKNQTLETSD